MYTLRLLNNTLSNVHLSDLTITIEGVDEIKVIYYTKSPKDTHLSVAWNGVICWRGRSLADAVVARLGKLLTKESFKTICRICRRWTYCNAKHEHLDPRPFPATVFNAIRRRKRDVVIESSRSPKCATRWGGILCEFRFNIIYIFFSFTPATFPRRAKAFGNGTPAVTSLNDVGSSKSSPDAFSSTKSNVRMRKSAVRKGGCSVVFAMLENCTSHRTSQRWHLR